MISRNMIKGFITAALVAAIAVFAQSANYIPLLNTGTGASTSSYTGPGDLVANTAGVWYGLRAFNAAYATGSNNAILIRRASDSTTQNILILSDGTLDVASAATFAGTDATCTGTIASTTLTLTAACTGGTLHVNDMISGTGITQPAYITAIGTCGSNSIGNTCTLNAAQTVSVAETITAQVALFIKTLYNQTSFLCSGSVACDVTNATNTAAAQPQLLFNCLGSLPCMASTGTQSLAKSSGFTNSSQPNSYSFVANRTGNLTTLTFAIAINGGAGSGAGFSNASNNAAVFAGSTANASCTSNAWHAVQAVANSTTSKLNCDGTETDNLSAGTNTAGGSLSIPSFGAADQLVGKWMEAGRWDGINFNTTQQTNLCHNQYTYWGTSTSC